MSKIIFTNGCFDILHPGHMRLLEYCKSLGQVIVGLNSDRSIRENKGHNRPFFGQEDRTYMLESCKFVDGVIIFDEKTPYSLIKKIKPDIIVKGGDYKEEDVVGQDLADVRIFNYVDGYSTSRIIGGGA